MGKGGVKNTEKFAYVVYGWSLSLNCVPDKISPLHSVPCPNMLRRTWAPFFYRLWLCDRQAFQDGFLCFLFRTSLWWPEARATDARWGNRLQCTAENSLPLPFFRYSRSIFFLHIGPNFQISLIHAFFGCPYSVAGRKASGKSLFE